MDEKNREKFLNRINDPDQKRDNSWRRFFLPEFEGLRSRIRWIESHLMGPRILDVGCGTGVICHIASHKEDVTEVHGVDLQEDMLVEALGNVKSDKVHLHSCFAEDIPFGDGYFDTVVMTEVLEHVFDEKQAVAEAARVLKAGGRIIVTVPFWGDLSRAHLRRFNEGSLKSLLAEGFTIRKLKHGLNNKEEKCLFCFGIRR